MNPTRNREVASSIPDLAQWAQDPALPWAVVCRDTSDFMFLWLWCGPTASSNLTSSLGTSICHGCGPKKKKRQKKNMELNISIRAVKQMPTINTDFLQTISVILRFLFLLIFFFLWSTSWLFLFFSFQFFLTLFFHFYLQWLRAWALEIAQLALNVASSTS